MDRRQAMIAMGAATLASGAAEATTPAVRKAQRPLRLLVLGGTRFIGLHMTEYALQRGHTLTFFNRGKTNADRFPEIERIRGDRNGDIGGLAGRQWDAVIDNSGYLPRQVQATAALLEPNVGRYVFVSSISVYPDFAVPRDEDSPVGKLADATIEKVDGDTYGPLKALCEQAASKEFGPARTTLIRPGLIVGPDDNTDRFTWWPARAARGGAMLAPGTPRDRIQVIDVRDLARFMIEAIERGTGGTFNLVSPPGRFTMGQLLDASVAAARRLAKPTVAPTVTWVPAGFLAAQKIEPWSDMPVWLPASGDSAAFADTSAARALQAGLSVRPLRETVFDTLAWHLRRPVAERGTLKAGLSADRELAALAAWRARSG
jgi:2'-hydroxyisoflavone reductase